MLRGGNPQMVLVPYKITLLSNGFPNPNVRQFVLVPYKITLLSNMVSSAAAIGMVLVPYKITLLSNVQMRFPERREF